MRISELYHPATYRDAGSNRINAFFRSSVGGSTNDNFCCHISEESEEDEPAQKRRSRLGLRVCPHIGFEHDYEWFCQEHGERAEEMWRKAETYVPDNDQPSTGKAKDSGNDKVRIVCAHYCYMRGHMCSLVFADRSHGH